MSLVEHAKKELALLNNDADFNECIINAVEAFAAYGHSEGSAVVGIHILNELLQFRNLSPLNNDPDEWTLVAKDLWQSKRNPAAFSTDGGNTFTLTYEQQPLHESEPKINPSEEEQDAGGTAVQS